MSEPPTAAEDTARLLLEAGVVEVSTGRPFRYASGLLSPIYTNCRQLGSRPRELKKIVERLLESTPIDKTQFDVIAAAGQSSIVLASDLADRTDIPMVFVRPRAKAYGKMKRIEGGVLRSGDRVLLVSDIISTEEDVPSSVEGIRAEGGRVTRCIALFDNKLGVIETQLREEGVPVSTLCDVETLVRVARASGKITDEQGSLVREWIENPVGWSRAREPTGVWTLDDSRRVAKALLDIGAVTIDANHPFRYTSGLLSPIYTDNRLLMSHPDEWKLVVDGYVSVIRSRIGLGSVSALAGTALSGIPHARRIAKSLDLPMVYVTFNRRGSEQEGVIEGFLHPNDKVVIIEDHVTTGASVLRTAKVLRRQGVVVEWCVAVFTYDSDRSQSALKAEGIDLATLCDLPVLMDVAAETGRVRESDKSEVFNWLANPEFWEAQKPPTIAR